MPITRTKALLALSLACIVTLSASAQMLARPGWAGFGQKSEAWWKHSIIYEIDPHSFTSEGLHGIDQRLDYIRSLGADAILLTHIAPDATHPQSLDPAIGTLDDLDTLSREASTRNMRILLDLGTPPAGTDLNSLARLWLNRGLAGFRIADPQQADQLRKITGSYIGERIVIGDLDPSNSHQQPQLLLDPSLAKLNQFNAATLRPAVEAILSNPNSLLLATDGPDIARSATRFGDPQHGLEQGKVLAALLLINRSSSLLYFGQEIGLAAPTMQWGTPVAPTPEHARRPLHPAPANDPISVAAQDANPASVLSWYRQLSAIHHSNQTLNSAPATVFDHDAQNVLTWVRKPSDASLKNPAVVVVCNLSAQPAHVSLKDDMQKLHLKGNFLRTLLRSDSGMGPMSLDSMTIPPYTVYIGQLRY
ncbi:MULTISPECIES: alpha-amylase family glycosyl hydrolase [Acidobacteriaceae]|uniref:alpha-amylase family glycosyl hydrolase n=1 Tax=Acidobacteriaceae TaxID=204434 RepID=UPI00131D14C6|nr:MULTISPECIES: alpha-amylase family glycosyl hydrolase [Acidobacteriaceae]MDW5267008.1 alpha-amylase family glycosyl hydrolase [Edaphobacter sp.]